MGDLLGFGLKGMKVVEDGETLGEDCLATKSETVLRKVAEGHAFDSRERPVVEGLDAGEDFQEGGFACAIAADQAGALVGRDEPVDVFKEEFVAEAFAGA